MIENPFFEAWNTPFELPPFDRIRPEHFPPAFDRGMAEHIAEIEGIAGSSKAPDFTNTVEALERCGRLLRRVSRPQRSKASTVFVKSGDRKSTRLNSSHRCISYAVFCLKKKKK